MCQGFNKDIPVLLQTFLKFIHGSEEVVRPLTLRFNYPTLPREIQ